MKNVKSIDIIFENCEYINIDENDIIWFNMEDIEESIYRVACNSICKMKSAEELEIILKKDTKTKDFIFQDGVNGLERLMMYDDITSLTINYDDGTEETIYVDWEDDIMYGRNKNQKVTNVKGNIFIAIGENKDKIMKELLENYPEEEIKFYDEFI